MKASQFIIDYIKSTEEFIPQRKADGMNGSVQLYSIGYGHQISDKDRDKLWNATLTKAQAEELFKQDLVRFENAVNKGIKVPLTQNQFDALVSFAYNVGPGRFVGEDKKIADVVKKINSNAPKIEIYESWTKNYIKSTENGVKVVKEGLVKRRAYEANLFFGGNLSFLKGSSSSSSSSVAVTTSTPKKKPQFLPYIAGAISVSLVGIGAYFYMKQ